MMRTISTPALRNLRLGHSIAPMADYSDALDINPQARELALRPRHARLKKGDRRGSADVAAAKAINADIVAEFARYGV